MQELQVESSLQRVRHEDSTKVERYRRDVWPAVGREAGVNADRAVSDVGDSSRANGGDLRGGDRISVVVLRRLLRVYLRSARVLRRVL